MSLLTLLKPAFPNVARALGVPTLSSGAPWQISAVQGVLSQGLAQVSSAQTLLAAAGNPVPQAGALLTTAANFVQQASATLTPNITQAPVVASALRAASATVQGAQNLLTAAGNPVPAVAPYLTAALGSIGGAVGSLQPGLDFLTEDAEGEPLLTQDGASLQSVTQAPKWGLFDGDGNSVIDADSVREFEYAPERRISDYPVEEGGFESYNKVQIPLRVGLTFAKGGSEGDRQNFLDQVAAALDTLSVYSVVIPEKVYGNMNAVRADCRRDARSGVTLLTMHVYLEEVRVTATAAFSNTVSPTAAEPVNAGPVQARPPTTAQSSHVTVLPESDSIVNAGQVG